MNGRTLKEFEGSGGMSKNYFPSPDVPCATNLMIAGQTKLWKSEAEALRTQLMTAADELTEARAKILELQ